MIPSPRTLLLAAAALYCATAAGCAALSNPVANGVPVRRLSPELLGESRASLELIPLTSLRQRQPDAYRLGPDDVLGIWIADVLGDKGTPPPITYNPGSTAPSLGFPVPVRGDGTLSLPLVPPIQVKGLTLEETEQAIRKAYTVDKQILPKGQERIIVTLQRPRQYQVLVIRQDAGDANNQGGTTQQATSRGVGFVVGFGGNAPRGARKGLGFSLQLPAYENDVLNAMARTGGFPGTEAVNEIIIERGTFSSDLEREQVVKNLQGGGAVLGGSGRQLIRIPLRVRPGETPTIRPEDIILENGDIVYIEARDQDVFFTGGLLPSGQFLLPRDSDLDVLEAITLVGGALNSGTTNAANVNGSFVTTGIGSPSPSLLTVIRRTPNGGQVAIRVNLNTAMTDPRERILVQPRDILLLQETPQEAIARYFSTAFHYNVLYNFLTSSRALGTSTLAGP
jgi:hypothetical protein